MQSFNPYTKPYLPVVDQLELLRNRGLVIADEDTAVARLERIGYYRLSAYWYPFRRTHMSAHPVTGALLPNRDTGRPIVIVEDDFRPGTTFQQVMDLYVFDKRLRLIVLDAMERVEIALRVDIALLLGARSPETHRDPSQFDYAFGMKTSSVGETEHGKWLARLDQQFLKSKEEFVKHFRRKYYGVPPPIWIAVELWDFGMLSVLLDGLKYTDKVTLALKYGFARPQLLTSAIRNLNHIRNICAHHSRLWNRSPADRLSPPRPGEIPFLDHLSGNEHAQSRLYASLAFLQHLLATINPSTKWAQRLKDHTATLPAYNGISLLQAGFPANWEMLDIWSTQTAQAEGG